MRDGISRREFLKGSAAGAAAVAALSSVGMTAMADEEVMTTTSAPVSAVHSWDPAAAPDPIADEEIVETVETEVLIIGGGYAGCTTAAAASENGAKVILVEKSGSLHGNGVGGVGTVGSRELDKYLENDGYEIDKVKNMARWIKTCGGRCRESLVAKYFRESYDAMNWLLDIAETEGDGAQCMVTANASNDEIHKEEHSYHMLYGGYYENEYPINVATEYRLKNWAETHGDAQFIFNSPAVQLVYEDGAVKGAICQTDAGYVKYLASKGTVLATGDISYDPEMMEYFAPIGNKTYTKLNGADGDTGDGHKMASWIGAALQDGPWPTMMHPQACAMFHGPFLFVSPAGKRYMNEATWVQGKCVGVMTQAKSPYGWSIFDANWKTDLANGLPYGGGMFWDSFRAFGTDIQYAVDYFDGVVEDGCADETNENYFKADTLEDLAAMMGVDYDTMQATIDHYNELCEAGEDTDFYKNPIFMTPIKEPPYYACKVGAGLLVVVGGLHISDDNEVLTADDEVIPGLYAVGNVSGDIYAYDYPINIQGNSHGRCLTFGKLLGEKLAAM